MITTFNQVYKHLILNKSEKYFNFIVAGGEDIESIILIQRLYKEGLGKGILVGDKKNIEKLLKENNSQNSIAEIIDARDDTEIALETVKNAKADCVLVKGLIKTDIFVKAILNKEFDLIKDETIFNIHVFEFWEKKSSRLLIMADGGINIVPDLKVMVNIVNGCVDFAHCIGLILPKVAILSAIETVSLSKEPVINNHNAAIISKMNDRDQIKGCIVDGPLSLDIALLKTACERKKAKTKIKGNANILIMPDINSGNILGKALNYIAKLKNGLFLYGAKVPIIITSRTDDNEIRFRSALLALFAKGEKNL